MASVEFKTCIYCKQEKLLFPKEKQEGFSDEHVLHSALSKRIDPNLPQLKNTVCWDCNQHFGNTIDRILTRSVYLLARRFSVGMKEIPDGTELTDETITFRIWSQNPAYNGAPARLIVQKTELTVEFEPSVAFKKKSGTWKHVTEKELSKLKELPKEDLTGEILLVTSDDEADERLKHLLQTIGHDFAATGQMVLGTAPMVAIFDVGRAVMRAVAKIGFNYMAFVSQAISDQIALSTEFDEARNFIRYDSQPGFAVIYPHDEGFSNPSPSSIWKREGHLVALDMVDGNGKRQVQAMVRLFDQFAWEIVLSPFYKGLTLNIASGHQWDLTDRACKKVF